MKAKIRLDTLREVNQFVNICSQTSQPVYITDGAGLRVSAKSLLGVMYALEFNEIWCECEHDIWTDIQSFIIV